MPRSASLVPDTNHDVYLVLDDFGSLGRVWRETDEAGTNRAWMVRNILEGLYENPVRIVAFNTAEGWSRDVTVDVADELRRRFVEYDEVSESVLKFLEATNRRSNGQAKGVPRSPKSSSTPPLTHGRPSSKASQTTP